MNGSANVGHVNTLGDEPVEKEDQKDLYDEDVEKAALTTAARNALPASDFVFPADREYPYQDISHGRNALSRGAQHETGSRLATIRSKVYARYPALRKQDIALDVPIWKRHDDSQHLVYGVVLQAGIPDSQGDTIDAAQIEKTAHRFLQESRKQDVQHDETPAAVEPVESYLAPHDMVLAGQLVKKGSWVMVSKVNDPEIWERIANPRHAEPLTGYSIGGRGLRLPDPE